MRNLRELAKLQSIGLSVSCPINHTIMAVAGAILRLITCFVFFHTVTSSEQLEFCFNVLFHASLLFAVGQLTALLVSQESRSFSNVTTPAVLLCSFIACMQTASAGPLSIVSSNQNWGFYMLDHNTPISVRFQIVAAFLLNLGTYQQIAVYCGNTTAYTVLRIVRYWLRTGSVEPGKRGRPVGDEEGNTKMSRAVRSYLSFLVRMHPSFYLAKFQARIWRDLNMFISTSTISKSFARLSWFRKRVQSIATEKFTQINILRTLRFLLFRESLNVDDCVYVDETGVQDAEVKRRHGRDPGKKKAKLRQQYVNRASRVNVVGAMTGEGMLPCTLCFHGSMTGALFEWWVLHMLSPCLRPGQTVIMDGARFHRRNILRVLFALGGVNLLFTPAHSPEFNPIEEVWGYLKAMMNR